MVSVSASSCDAPLSHSRQCSGSPVYDRETAVERQELDMCLPVAE